MQINNCLILAAGLGTRMGAVGNKLPKVLWPVFEKSLLELQVSYARSLGVEKIFINLHYMAKDILDFCKTRSVFEGVEFLVEEPKILDIGGAIHNLAVKVNYKGNLLVLNGDQFFYQNKEDLHKRLKAFEKSPAVLFTYKVNSSKGYNALDISEDRLVKGITKNTDIAADSIIETYTGISFIDLEQLTETTGVSSFFESVCPYKEKAIAAVLLNNVDYWDFGTINRYWETSFRILHTYRNHSTHPFLRFLVNEKALKTWKINLQKISYNAKAEKVINLDNQEVIQDIGSRIILEGQSSVGPEKNFIFWKGIVEPVN